ncbi:hypothetical protein [Paraburkholderia caballeronis]|uniref:hypothetical protein n=1 Tax=Paraburkholderia caballeronis TaxID=416943 RepID=UPI000B8831F6|nr:hypothetical protein [Paraburkholderia caballeronis]
MPFALLPAVGAASPHDLAAIVAIWGIVASRPTVKLFALALMLFTISGAHTASGPRETPRHDRIRQPIAAHIHISMSSFVARARVATICVPHARRMRIV